MATNNSIHYQVKTAADPRHLNRVKAFKLIFANSFIPVDAAENELAEKTIANLSEIDEIVKKCAPEWPLNQINRVDLSILRLAIYELLYKKDVPTKVIIDEAVEIGKRYGGQNSSSFVNGALAGALKLTGRGIENKE
ncbi:transcription antitermination factor NusB [Candidatus Collierbacteria bacterium]|nr:transcription antitermination factor NusB [Candidatus Collierbacteria bacterium]